MQRLANKVALISGASRGIGAAIAADMARNGARVVLAARKIEALQAVAEQIRAAGGEALPLACHVGKEDQIDLLFSQAIPHFGQVDVLVNNAATNPYYGPTLEVEWAAWDKTFEVNLKGYFAMARALARHLQDRDAPGSVINISSVVGSMGAPDQGVYAMTKAAVESLTKTLALELGPRQIRVNAIAPGLIETRFSSALTQDPEASKPILSRTALGRLGKPEDIAGAATYLASDESAYVTGAVISVDGGWSAS